jgi:S-DNA-T family DNA segregation ATPase FtsK/SpoIIIE
MRKIFLPSKAVGLYPLCISENMVLFNIEGIDGKWYIKTIDNTSIFLDNNQLTNPELNSYSIYTLTNRNKNFYLIATPSYVGNSSFLKCLRKEFSVGNDSSCDIIVNNIFVQKFGFKVFCDNNGFWNIQALTANIFLNDKPVVNSRLLTGDIIFFFGVKLIFIGEQFIISSSGNVNLKNNSFISNTIPEISNITPLYELSDDTSIYNKNSYFMKSPRFISDDKIEKIIVDLPPTDEKESEVPLFLTLGPQLTMLAMSFLSMSSVIVEYAEGTVDNLKFFTSMGTVAAMLCCVIVWPLFTRQYKSKLSNRKKAKRKEKYNEYLEKKLADILKAKKLEKSNLLEKYPSVQDCVAIINTKNRLLWQKSIDQDDFLTISLGTGTIKSSIDIDLPQDHFSMDDKDDLFESFNNVLNESKNIEDAPFTLSLVDNNISAVVGEKNLCDKLLDNIFLQLMTFHSYSDLKIIVFTSQENEDRWEYLKILPHCWDNQHSIRYFATNLEEFNEIILDIDNVFSSRKDVSDESKIDDDGSELSQKEEQYKLYKPYYLIFTDNINAIRNTSLIKNILYYKKNLGFSILIENDGISNLPDQTSTFVSVTKNMSGLFNNKIVIDDNNEFKVDFDNVANMYYCAKILANVPIMLEKGKYELPKSLSFLQLFNVGRVEQLNSLQRWKTNNPVNSLSVPIGIDQDGEIFKMDIHEKVYGPHGLVAGTTGSGKSEWIITYILSLAVNFSPDEVQFVLIDYKGGGLAMSFENKELGIKLPHLAGTITNLDKSAINRSIDSIESELKRRQSIFNDAREKLKEGQMDIYKYQQYYRKGLVDKPLSHLLIISDEFAELKQQQPEFMDQLISTSRIGRSLGVHLILATQKPSGVVNDQIWSNSRFKVCLRVQDKSDSNEILKKPDAANLKQVGAFYLEVGNDEYYNLGQSAWAGAKYYPSDIVSHTIDQSVQYINNIGKVVNYYDFDKSVSNLNKKCEGEELLNVVKYIDKISKEEKFVKQQLWLPNIPEIIYLSDIKTRYKFTSHKLDFNTVIGEYDEPRRQEQNILSINLADGNIAIVGQPGSGKEMLLSTIIFSSMCEHTPQEINYYILDFGAETLRKFSKFPHVGEVVFQDDMERVGGVIQLIFDEINKRKILFQDYNGSLEYYNSHSGNVLPLICCVINGYDVFCEVLPRIVDSLSSLFRDAPRYGIIFILSASAQNTFRARVLQYFNRFILMNLQDESQYRTLSNCRKGLIPSNLYGRGLCKVTDDDDSYCEFQTARITNLENELVYLKEASEKYSEYYKSRAKKIVTIPDNITSDDLAKYITSINDLPVGYNFYEKDIAKFDLGASKFYPIITKDLKKNINFIYALANLLTKIPNTVVRVIDISKIFDKPILDIKLFQSDLKVVFAAIAADVKNRKETQPLAINIILGVGSIKGSLDSVGQNFVEEMFNNIPNSKQNIFILVDEYKKFKLLKLQPWFNNVDTTSGLWLGPGIETQSVLVTNELSDEDKKYSFDGMAYLIHNSTYSLIKTMMDGDD